jgi:hypothetical protein
MCSTDFVTNNNINGEREQSLLEDGKFMSTRLNFIDNFPIHLIHFYYVVVGIIVAIYFLLDFYFSEILILCYLRFDVMNIYIAVGQ